MPQRAMDHSPTTQNILPSVPKTKATGPPRKAPPMDKGPKSPFDRMTEAQKQEAIDLYNRVCEGLDRGWKLNAMMRDLLSEPDNVGVRRLLLEMTAEARVQIMEKFIEGKIQTDEILRQQTAAEASTAPRRTRRAVDQDQVDPPTVEPRPPVNASEEIVIDPMQRTLDEWTQLG